MPFTLSAWVRFEPPGAWPIPRDQLVLCQGFYVSGVPLFSMVQVGVQGGTALAFVAVTQTDGTATPCLAASMGPLTPATWYHLLAWLDPVSGELGVSVNGQADSIAHDGSLKLHGSYVTYVGRAVAFGAVDHLEGRLAEVAI